MKKVFKALIPRVLKPAHVFSALLIVVILYLLPMYIGSEGPDKILVGDAEASNQYYLCDSRVCGQCCIVGSCQKCPEDEDPPPSYQPPAVASSIACDVWGNGGWCRENARLAVSASDMQGFAVAISGTNPDFSCTTACVLPLMAGTGTSNYLALAEISGLWVTGSRAWSYDPQPPVISTLISGGTINGNGWYTSPIVVTASATDTISGVSGVVQLSVDKGANWQSGPVTLFEGVHLVTLQGSDVAGNITTRQETLKIDTTSPAISITSSGSRGSGSWYASSVTLDAVTSDNLSGVSSIQYRVNDGFWTDGSSVTLSDGVYSVDFQVFDEAGNSSSVSQSQVVNVDTTSPTVSITTSGPTGNGDWYISHPTLSANSSDNLSGITSTQYRVNRGDWTNGTSVTLGDGIFTVDFLVSDAAGNSTQLTQTVSVDTVPPVLTHSTAGTKGTVPWYVSTPTITASGSDPNSGIGLIEYSLDGGAWQSGQVVTVSEGKHMLDLRATDQAGNQTQYSLDVNVDTTPPEAKITSHSTGAVIAKAVTLSGVSSDDMSGVSSVQLKIDDSQWMEVDHWSQVSWDDRWVTGYGMNGSHTVSLLVKDRAGNTSLDSITVHVENGLPFVFVLPTPIPTSTIIPSPTPTLLPAVVPTTTLPIPTAEVSAAPVEGNGVPKVATAITSERPVGKILGRGLVRSWRLYTVVGGLFAVFSLSFALDRRPSAYRKTAKILLGIMKNNSQQE